VGLTYCCLMPRRLVRGGICLLLFLIVFAVSPEARAGDEPILLLVHGDELPRERLRDAIANELHKPVALSGAGVATNGVVTVTYRQSARELAVTWDGPKRGTVSRVVSAPSKIDDVVRDAAMLAGNLARDEAEDLVAPVPPLLPPATDNTIIPPLPPSISDTAPPPVTAEPRKGIQKDKEEVTLGVFYPLATNLGRPWVRTHFDLNLLYGRVGQLDGFQLGVVNVVTTADGKGTGNVSGIQLSPFGANIATGKVEGLQLSPVLNIAGKGLEGWQTSFLLNRSGGDVAGFQGTWGVNSISGTLSGVQIGSLNISGDVRGVQLGLINVAKKVDGTTIGLINVADDIDGVPIGIASVTKTGGVHPQAWVSNATFGNFGIKLATKHTYTMPSVHYHHGYERDFVGAGFTIGGHIPIGDNGIGPYVDTDISFSWLYAPQRSSSVLQDGSVDTYHQHLVQPRLRALFGWRFAEHFGIFGGPGLLTQIRMLRDGNETIIRLGPEFVMGVEL
jgi:hypothetical protein